MWILQTIFNFRYPESIDKIIKILEKLNIDKEVLNQKISQLSGGQKIKLRLAECLAKDASLYLLDELQ